MTASPVAKVESPSTPPISPDSSRSARRDPAFRRSTIAQRCTNGTLGVVLVCERHAEGRHHGVAGELLDRASRAPRYTPRRPRSSGSPAGGRPSGSALDTRPSSRRDPPKRTVATLRSTIPCIVRSIARLPRRRLEAGRDPPHRAPGRCSGGTRLGAMPTHRHAALDRRLAAAWHTLAAIRNRHVVMIIMQENRSFDSYCGAYPAPTGSQDSPATRAPSLQPRSEDARLRQAVPRHGESQRGRPTPTADAIRDINGGKMNGYQARARLGRFRVCQNPSGICATPSKPDVMELSRLERDSQLLGLLAPVRAAGPHVRVRELLEPRRAAGDRLGLVCSLRKHGDPMSCKSALTGGLEPLGTASRWTTRGPSLTYLLHKYRVVLALLRRQREPARLRRRQPDGLPEGEATRRHTEHLELAHPASVRHGATRPPGERAIPPPSTNFYSAARKGRLPAVSWLTPSQAVSEHPPGLVTAGQTYVTRLINSHPCAAPTGARRRSSSPGTTGAASTTTRSNHPSSTERDTDCACPLFSR